MAITRVEVTPLRNTSDTNTRALANVVIDGQFAVGPFRVVEGARGLFVGHPQRKDREGQWHDIVRPLSAEARQDLHAAILDAYQRTLERPREPSRADDSRGR